MKLKELKRIIDRYIDIGHGDDIVLITLNDSSVGARASAGISGVFAGFDWESGQIRIEPDKKIISY